MNLFTVPFDYAAGCGNEFPLIYCRKGIGKDNGVNIINYG